MKKQTVMLLLFQALLLAQIRCKATIDMGTDAVNIDVGVDEDDDDFTDAYSNPNTTSNNSYDMDTAAFNNSETYEKLSKVDAPDLFPMGNQSTADAQYIATLELGNDRLGVNYRPKGYGLGANKIKKVIGDHAFSMELNRKTAHSAPESAEDASNDDGSVANDVHVAAKPTIHSGNSNVDDSNIDVETKGNLHSDESIVQRADIGTNEQPILVNMEYYQFQQNNSDEDVEDIDLDNHMLDKLKASNHGHTAKPYSDLSSRRYKYGNIGLGSRNGVSYVPVLYQKKNYSNEIVYEPVYPNPRGYYVPTVYPQYVTKMKNARSQPGNYPKVGHPVENKENLHEHAE